MQERCVVHEIGSSVDYRKMTSVWLWILFNFFLPYVFFFGCMIWLLLLLLFVKHRPTPELSDWKFLSFFFFCKLQAEEGFYFVGKDLSSILKQKFYQLVGEHRAVPQEVEVVMGRTLQVCLQSQYFLEMNKSHVGWWYFNLCLFYNLPGSNGC